MSADDYTPDQIQVAIERALAASDIEAVGSLMYLMAVRDPRRAERLREVLLLGIDLRRALDPRRT